MNPLNVVTRAFNSKVKDMALTPEEEQQYQTIGVSEPTIQRYLTWRKASLLMVIVATLLSAAIATYSTYMEDEDAPDVVETLKEAVLKKVGAAQAILPPETAAATAKEAAAAALEKKARAEGEEETAKGEAGKKDEEEPEPLAGRIVDGMHTLALYAMPIAAVLVVFLGHKYRLAYRVLVGAFLFSFFAPIIVEMLPMSFWEAAKPEDAASLTDEAKEYVRDLLEGARVLAALLPAVLSLIPGVQKACLRIKGLLPQSVLPGWFVVVASTLYGLFLLVIFVAIDQVTSELAILGSIALLALASLFYGFRAGVVTRPLLAEEDFRRMRGLQLTVLGITLLAGIILVAFLATTEFNGIHLVGTDPKKSLMSPIDVISFGVEIIGRSMFVSVVGAELMMRLNLMSWIQNKAVAASDSAAQYDDAMGQMQTVVRL